jgi:hypothetical protein
MKISAAGPFWGNFVLVLSESIIFPFRNVEIKMQGIIILLSCYIGVHHGVSYEASIIRTNVLTEVREGTSQILVKTENVVFWVVTPCGSCKRRSFGGTYG